MADWDDLKAAIANVIKNNGNQEITGQVLQNCLNNIVSNVGANATFAGIATPYTNPGTPDGPVFYIAIEEGIYTNFGGITLLDGISILLYRSSTWVSYQCINISQELGDGEKAVVSQKTVTKKIQTVNIFSLSQHTNNLLKNDGSLSNATSYWQVYYKIPVKEGDVFTFKKGKNALLDEGLSYYIITNNSGRVLLRRDYAESDTFENVGAEYTMPEDGFISVSFTEGDIVTCMTNNLGAYPNVLEIPNIKRLLFPIGIYATKKYLIDINTQSRKITIGNVTGTFIAYNSQYSIIYIPDRAGNKEIPISETAGGIHYILYRISTNEFVEHSYDGIEELVENFQDYLLLAIFEDNLDGKVVYNTANIILNQVEYPQTAGYLQEKISSLSNILNDNKNLILPIGLLTGNNIISIDTNKGSINIGSINGFLLYNLIRIVYIPTSAGNKTFPISALRNGIHYIAYKFSTNEFVEFSYSQQEEYIESTDYLLLVVYDDSLDGRPSIIWNTADVTLNGTFIPKNISSLCNTINTLSEKVDSLFDENLEVKQNPDNHAGIIDFQRPTSDIIHFLIYGQSLSTGQQTCPELSRSNYKGNLMVGKYEWIYGTGQNTRDKLSLLKAVSLNGENYIPTSIEDQTNGETPNINFANAAKRLLDDYTLGMVDRKILATSSGVGGQSIELLSKNCPNNSGANYNNFINTLTTIKGLVNDKTLVCSAIIWMQGEYNASAEPNQGWNANTPATNNKNDYKAYLLGGQTSDGVRHNGLINDMIDDVKSNYEQEYAPIIMCSQIGPGFNKTLDMPIDMALLESNNESEKFTLVAPSYCVTDRLAHLDANGSRWLGEYYAKVWYKKVILGLNWKPLQPNKVEKYENSIIITFDVPEPPIVFDQHTVRPMDNYGFQLKDGSGNVNISSVDIIGLDKVQITADRTFSGAVEIAYASINVGWGNLRDSDNWLSFANYMDLDNVVDNPEGVSYHPYYEPQDELGNVIYNKPYPNYNWCMKFYYKLEAREILKTINTGN